MAAMIITNYTPLIISSKQNSYYNVSILHRKTCNYKPTWRLSSNAFKVCSSKLMIASMWDFDYIQSLNSEYKEERYSRRASELKVQVKMVIEEAMALMETVEQLELIDDLQRLGISYHFQDQIINLLYHIIYENKDYHDQLKERNLYWTALEFRLLRQHGFLVSQDVFSCFKNHEDGEFKASLAQDAKGLLQLYESSFLLIQGESSLDQAREFAAIYLQRNLDQGLIIDENLSFLVRQALQLPLHWSVARTNARAFMETVYERRHTDMNPILLELAKLDFNIVQATHQEELKDVSRWWKNSGFTEKLGFVRDRTVENYVWSVGQMEPTPEYVYQRTMFPKAIALVTAVDDVYDVYGTSLEELQLFTEAFQKWDIEFIEQLPEYMQICYLAVNNFINEVAYDVLKQKGCLVIKYLRQSWIDYTRAQLQEAKWYHNGHTVPILDDYLNNGFISSATPIVMMHVFFSLRNPIQQEAVDALYKYHNTIRLPALIIRLVADIATGPYEMERGDVSKVMECYMNENDGASEKEAHEYTMFLIREKWKQWNKEILLAPEYCSSFAQDFIAICVNAARTTHYVYLLGDGQGCAHSGIKDRTDNLLFNPIE